MKPAYDPNTEELVHVTGDEDHGLAADYQLTKSALAHPEIRYNGKFGDYVIRGDLYNLGGEMMLHIYCPKCRHALAIKSSRKQMHWDDDRGVSVEHSICSWELDSDETFRREFGVNLCKFTFVIDENRMKDA